MRIWLTSYLESILGKTLVILDAQEQVIGIGPCRPDGDKTWESMYLSAAKKLETAWHQLYPEKEALHRRGNFSALIFRILFRFGQQYSQPLRQKKVLEQKILDDL